MKNGYVSVSNKRELFLKRVIFCLKSFSPKYKKEVYRLPNGREFVATLKPFQRFQLLQTVIWTYSFPVLFLHELGHFIVELLLDPWEGERATRKVRLKVFLGILAGPLSEIIVCLFGIIVKFWIPIRIYLVSASLLPLIIWSSIDFKGLLVVTGIWKKFKILYGFSASENKWYIHVINRIDNQKLIQLHEPTEQMAVIRLKSLERIYKTRTTKRKDIP